MFLHNPELAKLSQRQILGIQLHAVSDARARTILQGLLQGVGINRTAPVIKVIK